jgi:ACS family glucarate transporter-like MFS transporter
MTTSRRFPWPIVGLLSLTATAGYLCRVNLSTAGALVMEEFQLTQAAMGRLFSAFLLGYALFQIPAGALADRFGSRTTLGAAAFCWVLLTAAHAGLPAGFGAAMISLLVLRFLLGVTEAPTYPGAAQGVARWVLPGDRGRANGLVIASIGIGSAIAPPLVSQVMVRWGWRAALLVSALPALVVALVWRKVSEPASAVERNDGAGTGRPGSLRAIDFTLLTASYTLQGYVGYIFVFWFYLYLVQERKFDLLQGAWVSTLPWILSTISIPLGGLLSDHLAESRLGPTWGRRMIPMLGMGLSGILIAIGAHTERPVTAVIALALATALVLCVEGPFWATMIGIAGTRTGTAGGIMNMGSNLGGLVSPALTPLLAQHLGWENALYVAAVLSVIAAALWLGIHPHDGLSTPGLPQLDGARE